MWVRGLVQLDQDNASNFEEKMNSGILSLWRFGAGEDLDCSVSNCHSSGGARDLQHCTVSASEEEFESLKKSALNMDSQRHPEVENDSTTATRTSSSPGILHQITTWEGGAALTCISPTSPLGANSETPAN